MTRESADLGTCAVNACRKSATVKLVGSITLHLCENHARLYESGAVDAGLSVPRKWSRA